MLKHIVFISLMLLSWQFSFAKNYYVHPILGNDKQSGLTIKEAFKTLSKLENIQLVAGDKIYLAAGEIFEQSLNLNDQMGTALNPIIISSLNWKTLKTDSAATINFIGKPNGILIQDCSYITIQNIKLTGNGFVKEDVISPMRCGVLITNKNTRLMESITLDNLYIHDVYYQKQGFVKDPGEVKTANGTQKYGWGIRVINNNKEGLITKINILNCTIKDVGHTGIKLTGNNKNISNTNIINNKVIAVGGPGIQMSGVKDIHVTQNLVNYSGSETDSRKWGRGSGLWTWGSSNVLIEKNRFLNANGPGDSAGAHIDYNCDNIVIQYNLSAFNAGGFCEILGNNFNCAYRYNISYNDGFREKGKNGAFQEGKTLWLSGYTGNKSPKNGPTNNYIYNNTIYCDSLIIPKVAFEKTSNHVIIANNIFAIQRDFKVVTGDQLKADSTLAIQIPNSIFKNNLFLNKSCWPNQIKFSEEVNFYSNPQLKITNPLNLTSYIPKNIGVIKNMGVLITEFEKQNDIKLLYSLKLDYDILGKPISGKPSIGAIQ
jgi:hypothetical protein